jgi:rod shape-determining protein MreB
MLDTDPELCRDILEDGIILTGGGSLASLLAQQIEAATGVATSVSDAPRHCVALGLQRMIADH